jgi:uncharacterized protein (UPF0335 family)
MGEALKKLNKKEAAKLRVKTTQEAIKDAGGVSGQRLKSFVERIERLEEEKAAIAEDIRDVYSESKATGFEPKIIRKVVARRKQNLEKRREEDELVSLYSAAIGMAE